VCAASRVGRAQRDAPRDPRAAEGVEQLLSDQLRARHERARMARTHALRPGNRNVKLRHYLPTPCPLATLRSVC
jgi:hypothetical protein